MVHAALLLSLVLLTAPSTAPDADEAGIRSVFSDYRKALLAKDGTAAVKTLDSGTVALYDKLRDLALHGDTATVKKQTMTDRMVILRLRHEMEVDLLKKMGGRELLAYGVDKGWVSASSVDKAALGKISITGKEAKGEYLVGDQVAPFSFMFKKEAGTWRFNLVPLLAVGEPILKRMAKRAGKEEDDYILALLEKTSGKPVAATVWEKLESKQPARLR